MKKSIFTLLLLAAVTLMSAQTMQFEHDGNVFEEGQTIVCQYFADFGDYHQDLQIRNLTDNQLDVIIEKEVINDLAGTDIYFCWGMCYSSAIFVSDPNPVAAQSLSTDDLSFHALFEENVTGQVKVKLYAYARSNPDDRISLVLVAGNNTSVAEHSVSLGQAYPNPASSQVHFDYNYNGNSNVNVVVYNLLGQEVKAQSVNGSRGRINIAVDDLQPGIYFCSIQVNNATVKTEKFIVKR
jgi:hypothetical protein